MKTTRGAKLSVAPRKKRNKTPGGEGGAESGDGHEHHVKVEGNDWDIVSRFRHMLNHSQKKLFQHQTN
jgi:hypothetical protein